VNGELEDLQEDLKRFLSLVRPAWPHPAIAWRPLESEEKSERESGLRLVPNESNPKSP
jgi:hypothetical protein